MFVLLSLSLSFALSCSYSIYGCLSLSLCLFLSIYVSVSFSLCLLPSSSLCQSVSLSSVTKVQCHTSTPLYDLWGVIDEAFVRDLIRSCLVLLPPPNVTWRRVRRAATESGSSSLLIRSFQSEGLSLRKRDYTASAARRIGSLMQTMPQQEEDRRRRY